MNNHLSRKDFLKLTGAGLGALLLNPLKPERSAFALPQFPAGDRLARVFGKIDIHTEPNSDAPVVTTVYDDAILVWQQELVTNAPLNQFVINQRWVKTPDGYVSSSGVQPVKNIPNTPLTALPNGASGFWAEVTVPYVDMRVEGAPASPHVK